MPRVKPDYFRNFWARRALRIVPLYYAVVAATPCICLPVGVSRRSSGLPSGLWSEMRASCHSVVAASIMSGPSVLQHFSREDARMSLTEVRRVLHHEGLARIQMANAFGFRSVYHLARRGFRTPTGFDVRYWSPRQLKAIFTKIVGPRGSERTASSASVCNGLTSSA